MAHTRAVGGSRIYSRKVFYLYNESNEAMVKTKMVRAEQIL